MILFPNTLNSNYSFPYGKQAWPKKYSISYKLIVTSSVKREWDKYFQR